MVYTPEDTLSLKPGITYQNTLGRLLFLEILQFYLVLSFLLAHAVIFAHLVSFVFSLSINSYVYFYMRVF